MCLSRKLSTLNDPVYVFSVFAGRANGARTLVRRKIGRRRSLEISKRGSALPAFLRDKSRAPGEFLVGALNRYGQVMSARRRVGFVFTGVQWLFHSRIAWRS